MVQGLTPGGRGDISFSFSPAKETSMSMDILYGSISSVVEGKGVEM